MNKRINLLGAPGAGKSTMAADLFVRLKKLGVVVELNFEKVKDFVYLNKQVTQYEQMKFIREQWALELAQLQSGVEVIINDGPIVLMEYYAEELGLVGEITNVGKMLDSLSKPINLFLRAEYVYSPIGRFQTKEEVKIVEQSMLSFLIDRNIEYTFIDKKNYEPAIKEILNGK